MGVPRSRNVIQDMNTSEVRFEPNERSVEVAEA